ncbi:cytochrome c-550 PedF [Alkalilimnicola ehrlichii MLHE-1]|uniref:Cytochrome c550, putative n=1 Tax=Alkalilimnicola ehrlichii (strain ATCC BAA-1101 / DSM 17681 / MLHE-1) TaxID=187272 RepID=Q0A517_ALKEH|nr:cytochrome c-550 PedF [Alkalilimnicola ehrlichii]ABI58070.1 cytochrome c550, putative [Alkalilimnicola ehrlichii MLHE-1]
MATRTTKRLLQTAVAGAMLATGMALFAHGDVNPQPVDTGDLPELDDWKLENPFRDADESTLNEAIRIGERGYQANCAVCHGLGGASGGIAPDLRLLEPGFDDEYYVQTVRKGRGAGMPSFDGVLSQEAIWAIYTWLNTMHEEAMDEYY